MASLEFEVLLPTFLTGLLIALGGTGVDIAASAASAASFTSAATSITFPLGGDITGAANGTTSAGCCRRGALRDGTKLLLLLLTLLVPSAAADMEICEEALLDLAFEMPLALRLLNPVVRADPPPPAPPPPAASIALSLFIWSSMESGLDTLSRSFIMNLSVESAVPPRSFGKTLVPLGRPVG
jgi:hypothetical protein